jgi:hypothetical protein
MVKRWLKDHPYKLSLAWAIVIFILCATPGRFIPSANWLELLSFDKWVHAAVFFILVSLLGISVQAHDQGRNAFLICFLLSVLYGGALEIMQARVFSERSADWYDMIANSFGCLIGLLFNKRINRRIFK